MGIDGKGEKRVKVRGRTEKGRETKGNKRRGEMGITLGEEDGRQEKEEMGVLTEVKMVIGGKTVGDVRDGEENDTQNI